MPGLGVVTFVTLFGAYPLVDVPAERINEFGVDAFAPIHADRQLHLTNAHAYVLQKDISALRLSLKFGASVSRATGLITQLQGSGSDGLMQQNYDSPAWGIGPTIEAKAAIWTTPAARLTMDLSAAGMLYDRAFPAGGLRYNGVFQIGPSVDFAIGPRQSLLVGARWLHLSNGHGLTPRNPSFEGRGFVVRYQLPL
jgi:hypothetical protein